jgi:hypothetical protein
MGNDSNSTTQSLLAELNLALEEYDDARETYTPPENPKLEKFKEELEVGAIPAASYVPAEIIADKITPNIPVKPTVTPSALLPNITNTLKNVARAQPAAIAIAEPTAALLTGRYEKNKNLPEQGIFGDGYDSRKHGMYLEFPGVDVGRIPYYFNRTMYDIGSSIVDMVTPDPDPDIWVDGANNGVPMPEPKSERSNFGIPFPKMTPSYFQKAPMPKTAELLQSGIY